MIFDWKKEYYRYHRYFFNLRQTVQSPKVRSFFWLSFTLFVISFFALVTIRPTLVTIAKLNREINDKQETNQKLQTKIRSIIQAQEEIAQYSDRLNLLDAALPVNSEYPKLAAFLEKLATENQVELTSLSFERIGEVPKSKREVTPSDLSTLNFNVGIGGNYLKLKEFLRAVENSRRILKIDRINFTATKREEVGEINLNISGQAFFQKGAK